MELNPLRQIARHSPQPIDGVAEWLAGALHDYTPFGALDGFRGDPLEHWDPEHIRRTLPVLKATFGSYFRGEVRGLENIPDVGPALLVGNHSGGTMIADTFVLAYAFYDHFGPDRRFHQLAHDVAARMPGPGGMIRRYGTVPANHENARRAFAMDAPVLVYPGGDYETFRPSWHSDRIEFGGRKGFIKLALDQNVPIVPVVAIGGQETALFVTRGQRLARLTRFDRLTRIKVLPVQIAPPFGVSVLDLPPRIPLPAKITIEVLPPIHLRERYGASASPRRIYDEVTAEMQDALSDLSEERTLPLVG